MGVLLNCQCLFENSHFSGSFPNQNLYYSATYIVLSVLVFDEITNSSCGTEEATTNAYLYSVGTYLKFPAELRIFMIFLIIPLRTSLQHLKHVMACSFHTTHQPR
jgi:hypothetical protein